MTRIEPYAHDLARKVFWGWFAVGALFAGFLMLTQANALGGPAGLLQVGETSTLRPIIEEQLGEIPLVPGNGHDGQFSYAIALDLGGTQVPQLIQYPRFRYHRIAYPLVSSLFGLLDGWALLTGMIAVNAFAMGLAAASVGSITVGRALHPFVPLAVVLNPGIWLSVRLLTVDTIAIAFMCAGLALWGRPRQSPTASMLALSSLSKETFLMTPIGLSAGRDIRKWVVGLTAVVCLGAWSVWVATNVGARLFGEVAPGPGLPLVGLLSAVEYWPYVRAADHLYMGFILVALAWASFLVLKRSSWVRWPLAAWCAIAVCSSYFVWQYGNNAVRVFAPIPVLIAIYQPEPGPT